MVSGCFILYDFNIFAKLVLLKVFFGYFGYFFAVMIKIFNCDVACFVFIVITHKIHFERLSTIKVYVFKQKVAIFTSSGTACQYSTSLR